MQQGVYKNYFIVSSISQASHMIYPSYGTPNTKIYQFGQQVIFHSTFVINFLDNIKFAN